MRVSVSPLFRQCFVALATAPTSAAEVDDKLAETSLGCRLASLVPPASPALALAWAVRDASASKEAKALLSGLRSVLCDMLSMGRWEALAIEGCLQVLPAAKEQLEAQPADAYTTESIATKAHEPYSENGVCV